MDAGAIAGAMARVLSDGALRASLIERGFARVKAFSWKRAAARVREVYAEVCGAPVHA
jgi:glycosyltransferase involved in cell wall biosynthesis